MSGRASSPAVTRPSGLRIWIAAARPATLPASLSGVVVGLGAALAVGTPLRLDTALGCVAVALLLQVAANLANDLSDFRRGADTAARQGPLRVAAAGLVTERQLEAAIALVVALAGLVGLWLATIGGWGLLAVGALAILAALAYTGGPLPYGYRALGEVFVFVFFGFVAVVGTAYLQALRVDPLFVVAAIPPGALITAILVVNNLRDIPTDAAAGKRTLAVVLGRRRTQGEYGALLGLAYAIPAILLVAFVVLGSPGGPATGDAAGSGAAAPGAVARAAVAPLAPAVLLPLLTLPMARPLLAGVRSFVEPRELNAVLRGTARLSLAFSVLFALGLATAGWRP